MQRHTEENSQLPLPCRSCPAYIHHRCRLQEKCTCADNWYRDRQLVLLQRFTVFFKTETQEPQRN